MMGRLMFVGLAAVAAAGLLHSATAPPEECLPSYTAEISDCFCEGNPCWATFGVGAFFVPPCVACKFSYDVTIDCNSATCDYSDTGTITLGCRSREKLVFSCPAEPFNNILVISLKCEDCE